MPVINFNKSTCLQTIHQFRAWMYPNSRGRLTQPDRIQKSKHRNNRILTKQKSSLCAHQFSAQADDSNIVINTYTLKAWHDTAVSKESYSFASNITITETRSIRDKPTPALSLRAVLEGDPSHIKPCSFCKYSPFWDEHLQSTASKPFTSLGLFLSTKKAKIYTSWRSGRSLPLQWSSHQKEVEADT